MAKTSFDVELRMLAHCNRARGVRYVNHTLYNRGGCAVGSFSDKNGLETFTYAGSGQVVLLNEISNLNGYLYILECLALQ